MDERIQLLDRLKLRLRGYLYIGDQIKEGWHESMPYYLFKCPKHGYVKSYPKGYEKRLECPYCTEEFVKVQAK